MKVGHMVRALAGHEDHPAVVLKVDQAASLILVIIGTGTGPRELPPSYPMKFPSRMASTMGLTKTTYFYETAVQTFGFTAVRPLMLRPTIQATCAGDVLAKIMDVALNGLRKLPPDDPRRRHWFVLPDA